VAGTAVANDERSTALVAAAAAAILVASLLWWTYFGWLKDALELSFDEISTAEGMPVGTAKCYAHRARARLRTRLEPVEHAVA